MSRNFLQHDRQLKFIAKR
ncbi:hypothetical protein ACI7YW_10265 [Clostridium ljungdahlii]